MAQQEALVSLACVLQLELDPQEVGPGVEAVAEKERPRRDRDKQQWRSRARAASLELPQEDQYSTQGNEEKGGVLREQGQAE